MKNISKIIFLTFFTLPFCSQANVPNTSLQQEILEAHNTFRAIHGAPKLLWDDKLAEYAENHAQQCRFQHTHGPYGENLAAGYRTPTIGITAWYDENQFYSYDNPKFSYQTGHFTQMVWKSTRRVGCAFVNCNGRRGTPGHYLVCEYSPSGNITNPGYFAENVAPPQSHALR